MSRQPVVSVVTGLPRPVWRGRLHAWAFWVAVPAAVGLVLGADRGRVAVAIYGSSLAAVYGVSAAYHRLARTARAQHVMRRLDHSMIFLLIAGTYTPMCLVALPRSQWLPLLGVVWGLTVVGVVAKVSGPRSMLRASNVLYVVIGWLTILALPTFIRTVSPAALALMIAGGVLYSVGAVTFYLRRPDPNPVVFGYHEVWHAYTVLAGGCHFVMVALVVS
ncbi:MAG: hemolysin III family protein [Actinomycetota bacterium]|nr:hemolysin III family protein [Actinomycetota bacterium]